MANPTYTYASISANTAFSVPAERFAIYAASSCQLTVSVDGTNFSNVGDAFTGTKMFCDNNTGVIFKCSVDIKLSY